MASCLRDGFNEQIFDAGHHLFKLVGLYLACQGREYPARILHAMRWVENIMVRPSQWSRSISSRISCALMGSKPEKGSSKIMSSGS